MVLFKLTSHDLNLCYVEVMFSKLWLCSISWNNSMALISKTKHSLKEMNMLKHEKMSTYPKKHVGTRTKCPIKNMKMLEQTCKAHTNCCPKYHNTIFFLTNLSCLFHKKVGIFWRIWLFDVNLIHFSKFF